MYFSQLGVNLRFRGFTHFEGRDSNVNSSHEHATMTNRNVKKKNFHPYDKCMSLELPDWHLELIIHQWSTSVGMAMTRRYLDETLDIKKLNPNISGEQKENEKNFVQPCDQ